MGCVFCLASRKVVSRGMSHSISFSHDSLTLRIGFVTSTTWNSHCSSKLPIFHQTYRFPYSWSVFGLNHPTVESGFSKPLGADIDRCSTVDHHQSVFVTVATRWLKVFFTDRFPIMNTNSFASSTSVLSHSTSFPVFVLVAW